MKHATKSYVLLALIILMAVSCGPAAPVVTATEIVPTSTIPPTNTFVPTRTSRPEPTATLSKVERMFVLPTRPAGLVDTPTPIAAPEFVSSTMRLRTLSEEEGLGLIDRMNEYSYQSFPPFDSWSIEGDFMGAQQAVALAIQEYLYYFPESPHADRLRWQLAFINSIMYDGLSGNQYGDEWMIAELEKRLNSGEVSGDKLENILSKYWFVTHVQPVENLFGDRRVSWLYQVAPRLWGDGKSTVDESLARGSMFFVVGEDNSGGFEIYLLNSAWNLSFGDSYVFDATDHNENGTPEVALYIGAHSGTMCGGNLLIYEWKNDTVVELTDGTLLLLDCGENFEYSKIDGIPSITFSGLLPRRTELYAWNGEFYEFSRYLQATPLEVWRNSVHGSRLSYRTEAELLGKVLASGELSGDYPAFSDYLRYRLGTVYAFDAKSEEAIHEFQSLIASPMDTTRTVFPDMAKKFLEKYQGETSLYDACHQSQLVYDKVLANFWNEYTDDQYEEVIGFPLDPLSFGFIQCDEVEAFRLVANLIPASIENLPAELRKMGVDVDYSQRIDANLDGKAGEWLIIFDTYNYFLVFPDGSHYQTQELDTYSGDDVTNYSSIRVAVKAWNDLQNPVMIIQSGQELDLLEIGENYESKSLFYDFGAMNFLISNENDFPQLQIFYSIPDPDAYYPDHPWAGYHWDERKNEFEDDLLEYILFVLHDPVKAVEIVEKVFPFLEKWRNTPDISIWSLPYTYYLVGLSYELSGDQQKAVQIYWQLWHDFPESHYALMVRYKLEPAPP